MFSLHAGVAAKGSERDKLEHLARYIARPPIASERLALTEGGQVRYTLKTPYRDGTTYVIFELTFAVPYCVATYGAVSLRLRIERGQR